MERVYGALGMRHHAKNIACFIADTRNIASRPIGVISIAEYDLALLLKLVECFVIGVVIAIMMRNGEGYICYVTVF